MAVETAVLLDFCELCTPEQVEQLKARNNALRRLVAQPDPAPEAFYHLDSCLHEYWFTATGKDQLWN